MCAASASALARVEPEVFAVLRLASRTVYPILVALLLFSLASQAAPCCTYEPQMPFMLSVLVPDEVAGRWYACRDAVENDLGILISLRVMPTTVQWAEPPNYPIDVMRNVLDELIREDNLPDIAMLPYDLAREISDRCFVYDLDAYACYISWPFLYEGIDGVILPWASDLAVVFFEPGTHVQLGLAALSHPAIGSLRPPEGCCTWPEPEEPDCPCNPCGGCGP